MRWRGSGTAGADAGAGRLSPRRMSVQPAAGAGLGTSGECRAAGIGVCGSSRRRKSGMRRLPDARCPFPAARRQVNTLSARPFRPGDQPGPRPTLPQGGRDGDATHRTTLARGFPDKPPSTSAGAPTQGRARPSALSSARAFGRAPPPRTAGRPGPTRRRHPRAARVSTQGREASRTRAAVMLLLPAKAAGNGAPAPGDRRGAAPASPAAPPLAMVIKGPCTRLRPVIAGD